MIPKRSAKTAQDLLKAKKLDILPGTSQLKTKPRAERPTEKQKLKAAAVKVAAKRLKGRTSAAGDIHGFQTRPLYL